MEPKTNFFYLSIVSATQKPDVDFADEIFLE